MRKLYIFKNDTTSYQEFPIPENTSDFWEVEVDDSFSMWGKQYDPDSGSFVESKVYTSKGYAKVSIDTTVHKFRTQFITSISGQETIYAAKDREAKAYIESSVVGPFLQSEMEATGTTAAVCAENILEEATKFYALASSTEQVRRAAKIAIDALPEPPELAAVNVILTNLKTSLNEIVLK